MQRKKLLGISSLITTFLILNVVHASTGNQNVTLSGTKTVLTGTKTVITTGAKTVLTGSKTGILTGTKSLSTGNVAMPTNNKTNFEDELGELRNEYDNKNSVTTGSQTNNPIPNEIENGELKIDLVWGYQNTQKITLKEAATNYLILESPALKDSNNKSILKYKVVYSTKSIAEVDPTNLKDKLFEFKIITGTSINFKIENLLENSKYYFVIIPINEDNIDGNESIENTFYTIAKQAIPVKKETITSTGNKINTGNKTTTGAKLLIQTGNQTAKIKTGLQLLTGETPLLTGHGSAQKLIPLPKITFSTSGTAVTMKWKPVLGIAKMEVLIKPINEKKYTSLGLVDMDQGNYSFTVDKKTTYEIQIIPTDAAGKTIGNVKVYDVPVGPSLYILIAIMTLGVSSYYYYRFRKSYI